MTVTAVRKDPQAFAAVDCRADHTERRSITGGREGARVAVREDGAGPGKQLGAELSHAHVAFDVFPVDGLRFLDKSHRNCRVIFASPGRLKECSLHSIERPEQIDSRWAGRADRCDDLVELLSKAVD